MKDHSKHKIHHTRLWLWPLMTLMLVAACCRERGQQEAGSLYQRYASRQELKVAQVSGFELNDSVFTDVVMLQAINDSAWQNMTEEFDIRGTEGAVSWLGEIDDPAKRTEWGGKPVIRAIASHTKQTIGFYRIDNEEQYDALLDYQIEKMKNNK